MEKENTFSLTQNNIYLNRYAWESQGLLSKVSGCPDIIIVIPSHKEENIDKALKSLHACKTPDGQIAIIVIVNEAENAEEETILANKKSLDLIESIKPKFPQYVHYLKLPVKKAGVGLSRKIGMDEAVRIFEYHNKDGIIICYDADCTCEPNYLIAIENYYQDPLKLVGLVHYEHPLNGENAAAIILYELFLRYYINGLRIANYPFAFHTLGSCITVRNSAYQKQGGMNTRKAGEDFYFIHKMTHLGGIGEINNTTVYPSDRVSTRVPFGTGHAIRNFQLSPDETYPTYDPRTFEDLKLINKGLETIYESGKLPPYPKTISTFYQLSDFDLDKMIKSSGSIHNFKQRYYSWWDGFRVLKFVHYTRDHYYPNVPLQQGLAWLDSNLPINLSGTPPEQQLQTLRKWDTLQKNPHAK